MYSHPQWEHFDPLLFGEADGGGGAAGGAVEDGDEEGGSLHHGAVAAEHAAGSIDRLEHLDCAAGGKERVVARLLLCRPNKCYEFAEDFRKSGAFCVGRCDARRLVSRRNRASRGS